MPCREGKTGADGRDQIVLQTYAKKEVCPIKAGKPLTVKGRIRLNQGEAIGISVGKPNCTAPNPLAVCSKNQVAFDALKTAVSATLSPS